MKIIIPLVGTFGKSGGFRVLSQLANYWIKQGHEVSFLSYTKAEDPYFPTKAEILFYDNKGGLCSSKDYHHPKPRWGMFTLRASLKKALDKVDADVILANHCFSALPVRQTSNKAKKFYYVQAYEPEFYYHNTFKDIIYRHISKRSYNLGLNIIANALMYRNYREIKTDMVVFPGLDFNVFKPEEQNKLTSSKVVLGTIGRTEIYKGTNYVVTAFKELRKKLGDRIELHIAFGDKDLECIDGVKVIHPLNDMQLAKFYRSLTLYICAATVQLQAVHYPVIESMACKIPVITTGYYPARPENSYMIKIHDTESIVHAILLAITNVDDTKLKAEEAYKTVGQFAWDIVSQNMIKYFKI